MKLKCSFDNSACGCWFFFSRLLGLHVHLFDLWFCAKHFSDLCITELRGEFLHFCFLFQIKYRMKQRNYNSTFNQTQPYFDFDFDLYLLSGGFVTNFFFFGFSFKSVTAQNWTSTSVENIHTRNQRMCNFHLAACARTHISKMNSL